jgi:citrate lyase beta subunit
VRPYHTDAYVSEIVRAARILGQMQQAHEAGIGAIGLDGQMIDAPMIKQVIVICYLVKSVASSVQTDEF